MSQLNRREELERHVIAAVVTFLKERTAATGRDHWSFYGRELTMAFPGLPESVQVEALLAIDAEQTESWWDALTKTIDGEIVRNALTKPAGPVKEADVEADL